MSLKSKISVMAVISCLVTSCAFDAFSVDSTESFEEIDHIVVEKKARQMKVYNDGVLLKTYKISLGVNPKGHKVKEGDKRTPEGEYEITQKNPKSRFYRTLKISYPNDTDREKATKLGVNPGGDIMIHGLGRDYRHFGKLHTLHNWTLGCVAITDKEMDEIFPAVQPGTTIHIKP